MEVVIVGLVDDRARRQTRIYPLSTLYKKTQSRCKWCEIGLKSSHLNMTVAALAPVVTRDASMYVVRLMLIGR